MAKNAYGQESVLEGISQWNSRSNTHLDCPIPSSAQDPGALPKETDRVMDTEVPAEELEAGG